ncbi:2-C-methyl-D-erythritol 4-phosphate cytidylyltransferase [Candidatus Magnetomoraceae bacterium gMMP-15]
MTIAVIVAAGSGLRMKMKLPKQYIEMDGRPILWHTLKVFGKCPEIEKIFLVVPEKDHDYCFHNIISLLKLSQDIQIISGGKTRQDSVYNGLKAIKNHNDLVIIHDGVRPFVNEKQIAACIHAAQKHGAAILARPAYDTLKRLDESKNIVQTIERKEIWLAQTPQTFQYDLILKAYKMAYKEGVKATDDAMLVERIGYPVKVIEGSQYNIKITTPEDLKIASALLKLY